MIGRPVRSGPEASRSSGSTAEDRTWRRAAQRQRSTFLERDSTLSAAVFRDLGAGRTWRAKQAWLRQVLWGPHPEGQYLELGTGEGGVDPALYPARMIGVDPADRALVRTRAGWTGERPRTLVAAFGEELPFRSDAFDGVFGIDTLHHVASPARVFAEIGRVLRPGGRLAFVEPNPRFPLNLLIALSPIERGIYRLGRRDLARWIAAAGLGELRIGNTPTFLPSWPSSCARWFAGIEGWLERYPAVLRWSTGRTIQARKPRR